MIGIGEQIRRARKQRELTQMELALLMHVDRCTIVNWENGRTRPQPLALWTLEKALRTKIRVDREFALQ